MHTYDSSNTAHPMDRSLRTCEPIVVSRDDIEAHIARGHALRAEHIRTWARDFGQTWRSLFRRPGRLTGTHHGDRDRLAPSAR